MKLEFPGCSGLRFIYGPRLFGQYLIPRVLLLLRIGVWAKQESIGIDNGETRGKGSKQPKRKELEYRVLAAGQHSC